VWSGLAVNVPGDSPDPWVDLLQEAGFDHFLLPHGSVDGGEGFHRDNPARRLAVRKAPWTLARLMGEVAVGLCW
jgi:hypothetical protein